jgi:hypothetical protein
VSTRLCSTPTFGRRSLEHHATPERGRRFFGPARVLSGCTYRTAWNDWTLHCSLRLTSPCGWAYRGHGYMRPRRLDGCHASGSAARTDRSGLSRRTSPPGCDARDA